MSKQAIPKTGSLLWVGEYGSDETLLRSQAIQYARDLLCEHDASSDRLFEGGAHPDFKLVEPSSNSHTITIDQIRELIEWSASKPQIAATKIAIINPANAMNLHAANAFLKTLEEPNPDTLFLLLTHQLNLILPTIRSRCHIVRHHARAAGYQVHQDPVRTLIINDLHALKANQAEPVSVAAQWIKHDIHQVLYWLMVVLCEFTNNSNQDDQLVKSRRWWRFMDDVFEARRKLQEKGQPNTQLLVESLLIQYARLVA